MRLGAYLPEAIAAGESPDPWEWARIHAQHGFSAAGVTLAAPVADDVGDAYVESAASFGLQIAEVSAWNNPLF